jgi:hypothetical protein
MAIAGVTPMAMLFRLVMVQTLPKVFDPCVMWKFDGHVERFVRPCPQGRTGIPETRLNFVLLSLGTPTVMLLLAILGLAGAYRSERRVVLTVGVLFVVLTVLLIVGNFGIATLVSACCFLISFFLLC